jgi:hypothetical protein
MDFAWLVARIRAGPPIGFFRFGWVRSWASLNEFFVHHEDVRRANRHGPRSLRAIVNTCGSRSVCGLLGSGGVVGPFDEFAVLELRAGADERHEMGRVDRPPA